MRQHKLKRTSRSKICDFTPLLVYIYIYMCYVYSDYFFFLSREPVAHKFDIYTAPLVTDFSGGDTENDRTIDPAEILFKSRNEMICNTYPVGAASDECRARPPPTALLQNNLSFDFDNFYYHVRGDSPPALRIFSRT